MVGVSHFRNTAYALLLDYGLFSSDYYSHVLTFIKAQINSAVAEVEVVFLMTVRTGKHGLKSVLN